MMALYRWLWYLLAANPLVVRIVQGGSRRPRHLLVRMGYLGGLIALVVIGLLSGEGLKDQANLTELAKSGTKVFAIISYSQVVLVCLLSPLFMAGAIGQERASQTYDILLTTPLSNLQIVLGSLLGRLFFVLALLLSSLPLFSVLLIFGGVPIQSVFVSFGVAGLSAWVVGSIAVALSVFRLGGKKVVFTFVVAIAGYLVASYCMDVFLLRYLGASRAGGVAATTWLTPLHPLLVLEASLNRATYQTPSAESLAAASWLTRLYLGQPMAAFAVISGVVSLPLIISSAVLLRQMDQAQQLLGRWRGWFGRRPPSGDTGGLTSAGAKRASGRLRHASRHVWANPVAWREAHTRGQRAGGWLARWGFAAVGLALAGGLLVAYHAQWLPRIINPNTGVPLEPHEVCRLALLILLLVELAVIVLVAIYMSAGCVSREREDGTLDLILTTPITPRQYIWGKLRGLVSFLSLLLAVPVLTLAMVSLYTVVGGQLGWGSSAVMYETIVSSGQTLKREVPLLLPEVGLLLALMLVPFAGMCVMVGMGWSLKAKGVLGAILPSVGVIGCLTLVTGFCGLNAAMSLPLVGPVLNAFSPVTSVVMLIEPWVYVHGYMENPTVGRLNLVAAAAAAAGVYSLIVYSMLVTTVKSFDQTVRRLSGTG